MKENADVPPLYKQSLEWVEHGGQLPDSLVGREECSR